MTRSTITSSLSMRHFMPTLILRRSTVASMRISKTSTAVITTATVTAMGEGTTTDTKTVTIRPLKRGSHHIRQRFNPHPLRLFLHLGRVRAYGGGPLPPSLCHAHVHARAVLPLPRPAPVRVHDDVQTL